MGHSLFWCPRCGTCNKVDGTYVNTVMPRLVIFLRNFYEMISKSTEKLELVKLARQSGVEESILLPESRTKLEEFVMIKELYTELGGEG